jgi:hypothetical protein
MRRRIRGAARAEEPRDVQADAARSVPSRGRSDAGARSASTPARLCAGAGQRGILWCCAATAYALCRGSVCSGHGCRLRGASRGACQRCLRGPAPKQETCVQSASGEARQNRRWYVHEFTSDVKPPGSTVLGAAASHCHLEAALRQPNAAGAATRAISPGGRSTATARTAALADGPRRRRHRRFHRRSPLCLSGGGECGFGSVASLGPCPSSALQPIKRGSRRPSLLPFSVCTGAACAEHCTPPPCVFLALRRRPPASCSYSPEQQHQQHSITFPRGAARQRATNQY